MLQLLPLVIAVACHVAAAVSSSLSIDAVTLLLPPAHGAFAVSYPLAAHGGCFTWHTSDPNILQVNVVPTSACADVAYSNMAIAAAKRLMSPLPIGARNG